MTHSLSQQSINGSRLVRCLRDFAIIDVELSHKEFTQKLAGFIDFSDSIKLSAVHDELAKTAFHPDDVVKGAIWQQFMVARQQLVQSIIDSTSGTEGKTKISYPKEDLTELPSNFDPYRAFYVAHQRAMDLKIQYLQSTVRKAASGLSPELAQLVKLDATMDDVLSAHKRKIFAVIPGILAKRFEHLYSLSQQLLLAESNDSEASVPISGNDSTEWQKLPCWLKTFRHEVQSFLLAELEARLQTLLGLIEAINDHQKNQYTGTNHD